MFINLGVNILMRKRQEHMIYQSYYSTKKEEVKIIRVILNKFVEDSVLSVL